MTRDGTRNFPQRLWGEQLPWSRDAWQGYTRRSPRPGCEPARRLDDDSPKPAARPMAPTIYRFIMRHSARQQVLLLLVTVASFPVLYYTLELPKIIINEAISNFDPETTLFGQDVGQIGYLMALSGLFLTMVVINGIFKYFINTYKGRVGERMLRRLRYELYARVLRFPLPRFRKVSSGEIIAMITAEVEPLGGFIGEAIAQPAFQGGTLIVYIVFIFLQDPFLGLASIALYPLQGYIIPKLQRRVNQLGKMRVRTMRQISDKLGETVAGVQEIHSHDTSALHLADIADRYGDIYDIRYEIYRRKFFIKFLNNFINQLTPFFFYSIGGYLVISGQLSFGALVAVLAAYKDLAGPWRELLIYYQQKEDARIKYEQVIEQFEPPGLMDESLQTASPADPVAIAGTMQLTNVTLTEESGTTILEGVSCTIPLAGVTAIVNAGGGGTEDLAPLLARLTVPSSGSIRIDGRDVQHLPESLTGRQIGYANASPYLFSGTLRDNLVYGLKHRPLRPAVPVPEVLARKRQRLEEARLAGNTDHDVDADWIDYEAAGCDGPEALAVRLFTILRMVDLEDDVYDFGLYGTIDPAQRPDIANGILEARHAAREALAHDSLRSLVERFDRDHYNVNATVAENLLFGTPVGTTFAVESLSDHPYVRRVLDKAGLTSSFLDAGRQVAETMVEIFADLPPGHELFEQFSFIDADDLPEFRTIVQRAGRDGPDQLGEAERSRLMGLVFKLIPTRHRLGLIDDPFKDRLLRARRVFADELPVELRGSVELFDEDKYNSAASIQDNILFGRLAHGQAQVANRLVRQMIAGLVDDLGLRTCLTEVGLDWQVGVAGSRLSAAQRAKTALARVLLKRPALMVLNEATSGLDGQSQTRVHAAILEERAGRGLIWVLHRPGLARMANLVLVFKNGHLVESGSFADLQQDPDSVLRSLLTNE